MAKAQIRDIVPKNVVVSEPNVVEIHEKLAGKQAVAGSPAGSEAKPNPKIVGTPPGIGR